MSAAAADPGSVRRGPARPRRRAGLQPAGDRAAAPAHRRCPGLVLLVLLDRDASNVPLAAVCALPVGPAWSAALYAWHRRSRDLTDLRPARARSGAATGPTSGRSLKVWVPWLVGAGRDRDHVHTPGCGGHSPAGGRCCWPSSALLSALWAANALVITSLFSFRSPRHRPAGRVLPGAHRPGPRVGNLCVLAAATAVTIALLRGDARAARIGARRRDPAELPPDDQRDPRGIHRMSLPATAKTPYGGDYNPEQWPEEVWEDDYRLFDAARIDTVTLGVFTWAPDPARRGRLRLHRAGPDRRAGRRAGPPASAWPPAPAPTRPWLARAHPEVTRTDFEGRRHRYGQRHNSCPSSPVFRRLSAELAGRHRRALRGQPGGHRLARRQRVRRRLLLRPVRGRLPRLAACQVRDAGRAQRRLEHHLLVAHLLRLGRDRAAVRADRALARPRPHRLPGHHPGLPAVHVRRDAGQLPRREGGHPRATAPTCRSPPTSWACTGPSTTTAGRRTSTSRPGTTIRPRTPHRPGWALSHDLMRGLKDGQPFWLMEQTPSMTACRDVNPLKRPGVMRLWSWQAVAHGADAVLFFQMRASRGASEKYHGAVIGHAGRADTRVFREVAQLGAELERLGGAALGAPHPGPGRAALRLGQLVGAGALRRPVPPGPLPAGRAGLLPRAVGGGRRRRRRPGDRGPVRLRRGASPRPCTCSRATWPQRLEEVAAARRHRCWPPTCRDGSTRTTTRS